MTRKAATIQDVARMAKVSTATVSRAIGKPELVSKDTRDAVIAAIAATGYRVNQTARNLRMRRAGAILVLVPNLGKPFYSAILSGISEGFAGSDFAVLIWDTEVRPMTQGELAGQFIDGIIDGVISLDGNLPPAVLEACHATQVAGKIVFACEWVNDPIYPSIRSDNAEGARLAVRHLHALGHREIAHVTGPSGNVLTAARREGMQAERIRLGLPAPFEWIIRGDFSLESGRQAAQKILAMETRPTAIFCSADMVAFGLIAGLHAGGLSVPDDISVVGFDDIDMSEHYVPALTTIRQDRHRIGRRAAESLMRRLDSGAGAGEVEVLEVELVVRASTAAAKPARRG